MGHANDPKWLAWLHRQHSVDELTLWSREMRYFRYCRAIGGHANDGDQLVAALRCGTGADLQRLLSALGLEKAGWAELAGVRVFVSHQSYEQRLELSLSGAAGDPYEVTRADVDNALRVEALLAPLAVDILLPPRAGEHCFSLPE